MNRKKRIAETLFRKIQNSLLNEDNSVNDSFPYDSAFFGAEEAGYEKIKKKVGGADYDLDWEELWNTDSTLWETGIGDFFISLEKGRNTIKISVRLEEEDAYHTSFYPEIGEGEEGDEDYIDPIESNAYILGEDTCTLLLKLIDERLVNITETVKDSPFNWNLLDVWNRKHLSHEEVDDHLEYANKTLGGYGVESLATSKYWDPYYGEIAALYVNMGDTYNKTVLYDCEKKVFLETSWGNFVDNSSLFQDDEGYN